jgi:glycosyltransferase involved in cell wall biosynthesis
MTARGTESNVSTPTDVLCVIRHPVGGITTYMRYVYGRLDRRRLRVTVLAASGSEAESVFPKLGFAHCRFIRMDDAFGLARLGIAVARALMSGKVGLIHSQGATAGAIVSLVNVLWRIPHVITFHETFDQRTLAGRFAWLKRWLLSVLFARASRINLVSEDARQNMLEYFPRLARRQDRIVVIPNGVDIAYLEAPDTGGRNLRRELAIEDGTVVVGYLGRFMPEKGFPVLVKAMEEIVRRGRGDIKVVAVGSGAYEREYRGLVKERGLEEQFRFLAYQNDVRWIFRQIDVLAIPSLREACCLVAAEGLVLGKPVVASSCIGLREVLANTPAVLVTPNDPVRLADGLESAAKPERREQAERYRQTARAQFDAAITAARLSSLFEHVMMSVSKSGRPSKHGWREV